MVLNLLAVQSNSAIQLFLREMGCEDMKKVKPTQCLGLGVL
jgi:hypothetical protein